MAEKYTIQKNKELLNSEDYALLRKTGIEQIEKLAGKLWTDYNTHDPGITILELLCYAITDLGYRTSFDIKDILAEDPEKTPSGEKYFFTAAEIFPVNPVTKNDFRKILVDITGVRNAWLQETNDCEAPFFVDYESSSLTFDTKIGDKIVELNGLYNILLEFEDDVQTELKKKQVIQEVITKLHAHRNLCEDFLAISQIEYEDIAVCADVEVEKDADVDKVMAEIYFKLNQYFTPQINFYTIQELTDKERSFDEIFEGPLLEHGFIDSEEFDKTELRTEIRVSDIINFIMDIDGVLAVKNVILTSYDGNKIIQADVKWLLKLSSEIRAPRLSIDKSKFIFYKEVFPYIPNKEKVKKLLDEISGLNKKYRLTGHPADLEIPEGEFMDPEDYYPVQNEFPLVYGIGEAGLPDSASNLRKAQAKQLKAYLLFFEQLLANYLSQLANVKRLFSFSSSEDKTYFTQEILGIKNIEDLYLDYSDFQSNHHSLVESQVLFEQRRNRFLNHLLGRFCEEMTEYSLLIFSMMKEAAGKKLISDKINFLTEYPELSSNRGKAFNYKDASAVWNTTNVAGMKKRVSRLLGFENYERKTLATKFIIIDKVGDKFIIKVIDPDNPSEVLITSIEYPDEECAEGILHYILSHGDNEENYKLSKKSGKYVFSFLNDCGEVIAFSKKYSDKNTRDSDFQKTLKFFKEHCDIVGFHLIEHLLLRPRMTTDKLLPVCVSKKEDSSSYAAGVYRFEIFKDKTKAKGKKPQWRFRLRNDLGKIILKSESYWRLKGCLNGITAVKNYAGEEDNFKLLAASGGTYYFNITADNGEIVATSQLFKTEAQAQNEMIMIKNYVSFKGETAEDSESQCDHEEDPYSFRISVILPSWPEKFRNINFRKFVEKTIRMETPAHVFPRICWVDLKQMRSFEKAYKAWLKELSANDIPSSKAVNNLIDILFDLKNVYPVTKLHDCKSVDSSEPQVILDYSSLGII